MEGVLKAIQRKSSCDGTKERSSFIVVGAATLELLDKGVSINFGRAQ